MISREKMYKRKENVHCRIFLWVLYILPNPALPSQWFSAMGSYSVGHKVRALPRQALKFKLVQRFAFFGGVNATSWHSCDLFALKQRYWNTSRCPWRHFRLHSTISSEKPDKKRQFLPSAYLRNENELIWRVTASCLWNDVFGGVWNRQVKTKLGTGQFFHALHSYGEETTLLIWNLLSLKLFLNHRMEKAVFSSRGCDVSPWQGNWSVGSSAGPGAGTANDCLNPCSSASPRAFAAFPSSLLSKRSQTQAYNFNLWFLELIKRYLQSKARAVQCSWAEFWVYPSTEAPGTVKVSPLSHRCPSTRLPNIFQHNSKWQLRVKNEKPFSLLHYGKEDS